MWFFCTTLHLVIVALVGLIALTSLNCLIVMHRWMHAQTQNTKMMATSRTGSRVDQNNVVSSEFYLWGMDANIYWCTIGLFSLYSLNVDDKFLPVAGHNLAYLLSFVMSSDNLERQSLNSTVWLMCLVYRFSLKGSFWNFHNIEKIMCWKLN